MSRSHTRNNPFPGLRPFELDEEHLFFGREGQADELLKRLTKTHFLGVVGTSGSGKSSLLRAGLLPSLYSGLLANASSSWRIAILRPGSAPIHNLADALSIPAVFGVEHPTEEDAVIYLALIESHLRRGSLGLVETAQQARMAKKENLLVVVDQFEELFRFKQQAQSLSADDEAAAFVKLLLSAAQQRDVPIFVVLTMRSDFLGDCAQFRDLPEALNNSQYLVPRLTRDQLRRAIEGPIAVGGANVSSQLVNQLLNDVGDNPDQLPTLQHALMRTWDHWESEDTPQSLIDISHYLSIGGMERALSIHADQIYFSFPAQESRKLIETIFKRMTERGLDNREVRRPCSLAELCSVTKANMSQVISVIDKFREHGVSFLTPPPRRKIREETIIDISQESLMRIWDRLQDWMFEEVEDARIYMRLADTAQLYGSRKAALLRIPELQTAIKWQEQFGTNPSWANRYSSNFDQVVDFIKESKKQNESEENSRKKITKEKYSKNVRFLGIAVLTFFLSVGISWIQIHLSKTRPMENPGTTAEPTLLPRSFVSWIGSNLPIVISGGLLTAAISYSAVSIRIVKEGNAALVERLGRYRSTLEPGLNFIVPVLDSVVIEDSLREQVLDIPPQRAITKDNVELEVDAIIYWRIYDMARAYYAVEDAEFAMQELLITTLRSEIGKMNFRSLVSSRETTINRALFDILDEATAPWGIKVNRSDIQKLDVIGSSLQNQQGIDI